MSNITVRSGELVSHPIREIARKDFTIVNNYVTNHYAINFNSYVAPEIADIPGVEPRKSNITAMFIMNALIIIGMGVIIQKIITVFGLH